jgi:hypothetical protein
MSDKPLPPKFVESGGAPYVYFDVAPTFGIFGGAVHVELYSRVLIPGESAVQTEFHSTGRLRCSPDAAAHLRDALNSALKMLESQMQESGAGSNTVN